MGIFDLIKPKQPQKTIDKPFLISKEDRASLILPDSGYTLKYHYTDIDICWFLDKYKIPKGGFNPGNRVIFVQEPKNPHDKNAVLLMFAPQRAPIGYLRRGKIQDMVNDYIKHGDKVVARVSFYRFNPVPEMKIDIAFFKKEKAGKKK